MTASSTSTVLLSTTYFGPVQWYQKLNRANTCLIEAHEHFAKQTYRNRCIIATTAGTQALTVPVEHATKATSTPIRDLRISSHGNWQHLHWKALESAYGDSPFFMYYADDIRPFYEKQWEFLFDFNMAIIQTMCKLLDIHPNLQLTSTFEKPDGILADEKIDFRTAISPKHPYADGAFTPRPYYQVYADKYGFQPNLSILDLLFNMGNESIFFL